ncbi:MAG: amino acid aminotransferase [Phycisphaerales bacterium]
MFQQIPPAPPDAILGLTESFKADSRPDKINLGVGVYKDAAGQTPVLAAVKQAEKYLLEKENTKNYLPIDGSPDFAAAVQSLLLGTDHEAVKSKRIAVSHTPSGTAAVRIAADLIRKLWPRATLWHSDPTWPNHPQIFAAAGLTIKTYPYFDAAANGLRFPAMLETFRLIPAGDAVLLHGCCHNPTGIDPAADQWQQIAQVVRERKLLVLLDFAYQGFGDGLREDAACLDALVQPGVELLIASSYSKNFGLYGERVGALTVVADDAASASSIQSHVKACIRSNYSSPPMHGGAIVSTILKNPALRAQWESELKSMRDRIHAMRSLFVQTLRKQGVSRDFSFIANQRGMFSFSGLTQRQVDILRDQHALYMVSSGRINVAGMTTDNMDAICKAIASVL